MILVVDDNQAMLRCVARCLRRAGYRVECAGNAAQAMALAQTHGRELQLLLVDVVMRDLSGPELARQLEPMFPTLPVLFMTGHVGASARCEPQRMPSARVVMKPFDHSRLLEVIEPLVPRPIRGRATPDDVARQRA